MVYLDSNCLRSKKRRNPNKEFRTGDIPYRHLSARDKQMPRLTSRMARTAKQGTHACYCPEPRLAWLRSPAPLATKRWRAKPKPLSRGTWGLSVTVAFASTVAIKTFSDAVHVGPVDAAPTGIAAARILAVTVPGGLLGVSGVAKRVTIRDRAFTASFPVLMTIQFSGCSAKGAAGQDAETHCHHEGQDRCVEFVHRECSVRWAKSPLMSPRHHPRRAQTPKCHRTTVEVQVSPLFTRTA